MQVEQFSLALANDRIHFSKTHRHFGQVGDNRAHHDGRELAKFIFCRLVALAQGRAFCDEHPQIPAGDFEQQFFLATDVVIQRASSQASGFFQLSHAGRVKPARRKQLRGDFQYSLLGACFSRFGSDDGVLFSHGSIPTG
ncbi:hypothetical protein D3C84_894490 [compost metagenome]